MLIAALFIIAPKYKQHNCPWTWVNKLLHIHSIKYSTVKRSTQHMHAKTWKNLKKDLCPRSAYCVIPCIYNFRKCKLVYTERKQIFLPGLEVERGKCMQRGTRELLGWWKCSVSCWQELHWFETHWAGYFQRMQFIVYKLYLDKAWETLGMPMQC